MAVKHQIIMRAGTIHVFLLFVYCSYHAPYLEVPDQQRCAGICLCGLLSETLQDGSCMCVHLCLCAFRCASSTFVCAFLFNVPT